jgi:hypothetical protein
VITGGFAPRDAGSPALEIWRALARLFGHGRASLFATAPVAWVGVSLLPDIHPSLRLPTWLALAGVVGLGAELSTRLVAPDPAWRRGWGTFWFIPGGAVFLAVVWFSAFPDRSRTLVPLVVVAVLGTMVLQRLEVAGPQTVRAGAHAIGIGLAFAIAYVAYATAAQLRSWSALPLVAAATALAALVVMRDARASRRSILGLAGATALIATELGVVLAGGPAAPWVSAALLVLALYAGSGVGHAVLESAPRHVYVELGLVTAGGLIAVLVVTNRPG